VPDDQATADFIITHAKNQTDLPKVLIVGDSISGGYSKPLIDLLEGKVELTKLGAVAGYRIQKETFWHSRGEAKNLDFGSAKACIVDFERFGKHLDDTPYDVIHFNFGLNDIFCGRSGAWHNPVDQYAKDLARIVTLLKGNGAKVIWATTTPIPANAPHNPKGDELVYNAAAEKVMKEHGISINDLHHAVTQWNGYAEWIMQGDDVHFPGAVYSKLAEQISRKFFAQLESSEG
jgi:acyl-CoA thioesterase-1